MRWLSGLSEGLFRVALRWLVPSLDEEDRREACRTFRELGVDARNRGVPAYMGFILREVRSLLSLALRERREARVSPGSEGSPRRNGFSRLLDAAAQDTRYAVRNLARSPGFVIVSVLSLTFGIAVSSGLFSVVNAVLFRPLPHAQEADRLVRVFSSSRGSDRGPVSFPDFQDLRESSRTLDDLASIRDRTMLVGSASEATRPAFGVEVSENYFRVLGIRMALGRGFVPEDVAAGGGVAIIGYRLWQDRFRGDPDILGRTIHIDGHLHTIVGVGPDGMVGLQGPALVEVAVPVVDYRDVRGRWANTLVGRMAPGVTLQQVQAELDAFAAHQAEEYPEVWAQDEAGTVGLKVMTPRQALLPSDGSFFLAAAGFLSVVGLILLIACSNVANLLLTRALKRREEVALRAAIGASRRRVLGQLLMENLLLFGLSGLLSLLLVYWFAALATAGASFLPPAQVNIALDGKVVLFVLGLVLLTGLTFGMAPALQASRPNLASALKGRAAPPRFRFLGMRNLLVGAQVGGSLLIVLVSLLLAKSLAHAGTLDPGFDPEGITVLELDLRHGDYQEPEGRFFLATLTERIRAMPGVTAVAMASGIPLRGTSTYLGGLEPEGYDAGPEEWVGSRMNVVTPGYLKLLGIRLLRGRDLGPQDVKGAESVLLVSQSFVDRFWPGESGVGKVVGTSQGRAYRVVGVVEDIAWRMPGEETEPLIFLAYAQEYEARMALHIKTAGDPGTLFPALRQEVGRLDPDLPVVKLDRMETLTARATQVHRLLVRVLGIAGALTLGLAVLGIYGVVAFSVSQRTREVGIRVALGAEAGQVVRMVVREGLFLALIGLVPGLLLSVVVAQLMRTALMGLPPLDPTAFGGSVTLLLLSVMAAAWVPARRAARADPMEALRED